MGGEEGRCEVVGETGGKVREGEEGKVREGEEKALLYVCGGDKTLQGCVRVYWRESIVRIWLICTRTKYMYVCSASKCIGVGSSEYTIARLVIPMYGMWRQRIHCLLLLAGCLW